jgi:hypothetical protein
VPIHDVDGIPAASSSRIGTGVSGAVLELAIRGISNQVAVFEGVLFRRNGSVVVRGNDAN